MKCGKCEYDTDRINRGSSVEVQQMLMGWHGKDGCSHEDYVEEENCQDGEFLCIDNDRGRALFTKDRDRHLAGTRQTVRVDSATTTSTVVWKRDSLWDARWGRWASMTLVMMCARTR